MKIWQIAGMSILALLLVADIYLHISVADRMNRCVAAIENRKSPPCESVPLKWAINNYECANSLLAAMNVTNVKFEPPRQDYQQRANSSVFTAKS